LEEILNNSIEIYQKMIWGEIFDAATAAGPQRITSGAVVMASDASGKKNCSPVHY
jgi:hypothetical protein